MMKVWNTGLAAALAVGVATVGVAFAQSVTPGQPSEAQVQPKQAKVGHKAPDFTLTDTDGKEHKLSDLTAEGKIVVLEWFNYECPYVVKHHKTHTTMRDLNNEFKDRGVQWIAINTGADGKQGAGLEKNKNIREKWSIDYPILLDQTGDVGRLYGAKTTPHMYIIDADGVLRYAGGIDNNNSPSTLGDTNYVKQALTEILAGETVSTPEARPYGCSVKY